MQRISAKLAAVDVAISQIAAIKNVPRSADLIDANIHQVEINIQLAAMSASGNTSAFLRNVVIAKLMQITA